MKEEVGNTPVRDVPLRGLARVFKAHSAFRTALVPLRGRPAQGVLQKTKQKLLITIICFFLFVSCTPSKPTLRLAIAANLMPPIEAITQAYEAQTGHQIEISAASSGALNAQIRNGAPFDIFLSANEQFPQQLFAEGIGEELPFVFAFGQLMLWSKAEMPADSLEAFLRKITSQKLAMPDPELAPYGAAAKAWMQSHALWEKLSPNLIIGNNISHTNQIIRSGSVDFAFTAASARYWGNLGEQGHWSLVPGVKAIPHSLLLLNKKEEGKRFVEFLNSEVGLEIWEMYGYIRR